MSNVTLIEFDGHFTITYTLGDGRESAIRVLAELAEIIREAFEVSGFAVVSAKDSGWSIQVL